MELLPSLVAFFARKFWNSGSDLVCNEEVFDPCKVPIKTMEAISSRRKVDSWVEPANFVTVQIPSEHIMQFVWNKDKDVALYKKRRYIPLSQ